MTTDLRETRLALPVYRPAKWLVRTLVCQPDRHDLTFDELLRQFGRIAQLNAKQSGAAP